MEMKNRVPESNGLLTSRQATSLAVEFDSTTAAIGRLTNVTLQP